MSAVQTVHSHDLAVPLDGSWPDVAWRDTFACRECALRTLIMLMNGAQWVMRRVERVAFYDDRAAGRRVSVDFVVPGQAPRYCLTGDRAVCLIPLAVMRRKTLVNFSLTDADGSALSLVSMRHNQALTEQMILALADITPHVQCTPQVEAFAHAVAFGTQSELTEGFDDALAGQLGADVRQLIMDPAAERLLRRLANNFLMLVTVDDVGPLRRIVRFSYDEPLTLTYKRSGYDVRSMAYVNEPKVLKPWNRMRLATAIGWSPTVIRFPTPAAENTASYHFEIEAPPGVVLASASMVAGRPTEDNAPSWDHVAGGLPVVGLHVVDVPNGSMSRAQVSLRLDRRGWLSLSMLASVLSAGLLWATAILPAARGQSPAAAAALLTITAAVVVFIAQPAAHQMASRLVTSVRAAAAISVILLITVGAVITFTTPSVGWLRAAAIIASLCTSLVVVAWLRARPSHNRISPWEQGLGIVAMRRPGAQTFDTLDAARREFGFDQPAVMVESSEGDHREAFGWTRSIEQDLNQRLSAYLSACGTAIPSPRPDDQQPTSDRSVAAPPR